jgi:hypothetical protein
MIADVVVNEIDVQAGTIGIDRVFIALPRGIVFHLRCAQV